MILETQLGHPPNRWIQPAPHTTKEVKLKSEPTPFANQNLPAPSFEPAQLQLLTRIEQTFANSPNTTLTSTRLPPSLSPVSFSLDGANKGNGCRLLEEGLKEKEGTQRPTHLLEKGYRIAANFRFFLEGFVDGSD